MRAVALLGIVPHWILVFVGHSTILDSRVRTAKHQTLAFVGHSTILDRSCSPRPARGTALTTVTPLLPNCAKCNGPPFCAVLSGANCSGSPLFGATNRRPLPPLLGPDPSLHLVAAYATSVPGIA
eukprot:2573580-Rhodomonas_salina.3